MINQRWFRAGLHTTYVRPNVIANDERGWHPEPDETLGRQALSVSTGYRARP